MQDFIIRSKKIWLAVGLVFLFSLVIRVDRAQVEGWWGDEYSTINMGLVANNRGNFRGWLGAVFGGAKDDAQMPISYVAIRVGRFIGGMDPWSFRGPTVVLGSLTCALLVYLGALYGSLLTGILFGVTLALTPWHIAESAQVRPYVWVALFIPLLFGIWLFQNHKRRLDEEPLSRGARWQYLLAATAAIWTNIFAIFFSIGLTFIDTVRALLNRRHPMLRKNLWTRVALWSAPFVLALPYLYLIRQKNKGIYYRPDAEATNELLDFLGTVVAAPGNMFYILEKTFHGLPNLLAVLVAVVIVGFLQKGRAKRIYLMGVAAVLFANYASAWFSCFVGRGTCGGLRYHYCLPIMMGTWTLLLYGVSQIMREHGKRIQQFTLVAQAAVIVFMAVNFSKIWRTPLFEDWRKAISFMYALPEDHKVIFRPDWNSFNLEWTQKVFQLEPRKFDPAKPKRTWIFTMTDFGPDYPYEGQFPKDRKWYKVYDQDKVYGWSDHPDPVRQKGARLLFVE